MTIRIGFAVLLTIAGVSLARADMDIVVEDFESYESDAAMQAVWVPTGTLAQDPFLFDFNTSGQPYTDITPPDPGSVDGQAVFFDGTTGGIAKYANAFSVSPSATQNVVVSGDLAHDQENSNKRLTLGLRYTGETSENLVEIGFYNGFPQGPNGEFFQFGFRTALMPGNTNWQKSTLPEDKDQLFEIAQKGFHTFQATISLTDITFQVDLFGDGINNSTGASGWDATDIIPAVTSANGYNDLRFGGPSGITSASPFLGIDNISLRLVDVIAPPGDDADFNDDEIVDGRDFLIWQRGFGVPDALNENGDANGDQAVDAVDLGIWQAQYGDAPPLASLAAVPEPGSLALLLLGALALHSRTRRH